MFKAKDTSKVLKPDILCMIQFLTHFPAETRQWSLVWSVKDCILSFAVQFPTQTLFSLGSVCGVLKKLPLNLAARNPTGEVPPANMYSTSKPGCIISVMFKGCPSKRQASEGGRFCCIIPVLFFPPSLVKNTVCLQVTAIGLDRFQEVLYGRIRNAQSLPYFPRKHSKENIFQISAGLIHSGWLVPTLAADWALVRWISNESSLTYIPLLGDSRLHPRGQPRCSLEAGWRWREDARNVFVLGKSNRERDFALKESLKK